MDKKLRRSIMLLIVFAIVVFSAVTNITAVWTFVKGIGQIVLPITTGLIIAFILNVPMKSYEKLMHQFFPRSRKWPAGLMHVLSLFLTLLSIVLLLTLVITVALPGLVESAKSIYDLINEKIPLLTEWLESKDIDTTKVTEWRESLDINKLINTIGSGAGSVFLSIFRFASEALSSLANVIFALVIAFYVLLSKDSVTRYSKKLLYTFVNKEWGDRVCGIASLANRIFSQYLSGQCIEAFILGMLITITFSLCGFPYAGVIGIMTGISAFIPFVGAFIACMFGAFLILLVSPMQALLSIVVAIVVQFVETQFIYPLVVGGSVGLSPLLTLLAALLGGKLMGLFGIIFFIPLTAVVYTILKEYANKKLSEKNVKIE